ncbi:MAG: SDR family NAD(P)-dependent oxidoreductase [Deltaproteobacteria bacterium]|jgi:3-oxoacyl-(acyl-carrier-protein) synthase/acyl carrier protein/NAD(P)-dependent dehydrogenase (short-subunit alcohol dehydrogenase family)|nr:SDR family NAD(P)-dependent oxidoreductase [Deltaproteobacteria bacterium]
MTQEPTIPEKRIFSNEPAAVIGLGAIFPGTSPGLAGYWTLIRLGLDAIIQAPKDRFVAEDYFNSDPKAPDSIYCRRGSFISPVAFSPLRYGITPKDMEATDSTQLLALLTAEEALRDSGYPPESFDHSRTAVILGVTGALKMVVSLGSRLAYPQLKRALEESGVEESLAEEILTRFGEKFPPWRESSFPGLLGNVTAGRIANRLNLGGPNLVTDAACASSLAAVSQALAELHSHRSDLVVTGGVDTFSDPFMYTCFCKTPALSPSQEIRPFDSHGDGTVLGEGLGIAVLKRLSDAKRDGDRIHAVIYAAGGSSDGRGTAIFAPSVSGQARAMESAYQAAGWKPEQVELVEAHGTGTPVGDKVEVQALTERFLSDGPNPYGAPWCALGTVKSQIGHAKAAAGAAGLIKAILSLSHKVLPPTIKVKNPLAPLGDPQTPFYINSEARPWISSPDRPRRAAVSSFGFGGANYHILLEEADRQKPLSETGLHLIALSGQSTEDLERGLISLQEAQSPVELDSLSRAIAYQYKSTHDYRLILSGEFDELKLSSIRAAAAALSESFEESSKLPKGVFLGRGRPKNLPLVFLYEGFEGDLTDYLSENPFRELALSFPQLQGPLDRAEEIRRLKRWPYNLSLSLYPPALAPMESLKSFKQTLSQSRSLSLMALTALLRGVSQILQSFNLKPAALVSGPASLIAALGESLSQESDQESVLMAQLMMAAETKDGQVSKDPAEYFTKEPIFCPQKALYGPEGLIGDMLALKNNLEADPQKLLTLSSELISGSAIVFRPIDEIKSQVLKIKRSFKESFIASSIDSVRSLAHVLGAMAARGEAVDFSAWPTLPPALAAPEGHRVLVGGGNLFIEPESRPKIKESENVKQRISRLIDKPESSSKLNESLSEMLTFQKESLKILKDINSSLNRGQGTSFSVNQIENQEVLRSSSQIASEFSALASVNSLADLKSKAPSETQGSGGNGSKLGETHLSDMPQFIGFSSSIWETLTSIVSSETGYPAESLEPDMELENDLGLDSIKRVELLSALSRSFPLLATAATDMDKSLSLGAIASIIDSLRVSQDSTHSSPTSAVPLSEPIAEPLSEEGHIRGLLFETLSRETGYPVDSLKDDMELEVDLGLDSIKRVELLSVLTEKFPYADAACLSSAKTLDLLLQALSQARMREIEPDKEKLAIEKIGIKEPIETLITPKSSVPKSSVIEAAARETGYPLDSLRLDMELEADLGLDSIKKIEIISVSSEGLADFTAQEQALLAQAKTLGDWHDVFNLRDQRCAQEKKVKLISDLSPPQATLEAWLEPSAAASSEAPQHPKFNPKVSRQAKKENKGKALLEKALEMAESQPSVWRVEPEPFEIPKKEPNFWPPQGLIRIVGAGPLTKSIQSGLKRRNYEVERVNWSFDFQKWRDKPGAEASTLILVWPGADRDSSIITGALRALESSSGPALKMLIGLSFLGGQFGFPKNGAPGRLNGNSISGSLVGLLKCAAREWPEVSVRALDLPLALYEMSGQTWLDSIFKSAFCSGPVEIGLPACGRPCLLTLKPYIPSESSEPLLSPGDTVVVTGGGRGVTAAVLTELSKLYRPRLIILGRTPLSPSEPDWLSKLKDAREIKSVLFSMLGRQASPRELESRAKLILSARELKKNLEALSQAGAEVIYMSDDLTNPMVIEGIARKISSSYGPIKGFIHGAGVLADHPIKGKNQEEFARVYSTKTQLATLLLEAFQSEPLRLTVFFSSSTARFGRQGQADYAAGNEVLNKIAWEMTAIHPNCRALAVNWGPWAAGMVTDSLADQFKAQGVGLIGLKEGAETFLKLIRSPIGEPSEVVVLGCGTAVERLQSYGWGGFGQMEIR